MANPVLDSTSRAVTGLVIVLIGGNVCGRRAKERLGRFEEQLQSQADLAAQRRELVIITRLEHFTARIKDGLRHADLHTKRNLVRALVRRAEIGPDGVSVVFRVDPAIRPSVPPGKDYGRLYKGRSDPRVPSH